MSAGLPASGPVRLRIVPARAGLRWVSAGIRTFLRQPLGFGVLLTMFLLLTPLLAMLPVLGTVAVLALLPALTLGMMAAARDAAAGARVHPATLFAGLRGPQRGSMLTLGGIYAAAFLVAVACTAAVDGGDFARAYLLGTPVPRETMQSDGFLGAMWVVLALWMPLSLLFWHSPALVHWHGVPPVKSMFFSAVACFRNLGAFTLFGLAWAGVFAVGSVALALVGVLLASLGLVSESPMGAALLSGLVAGGALVMMAMFFASLWATFQDCFEQAGPASDAPQR
ncbi:MAG: BPSS1780 family membrane protein [Xylophilus ampelinus]